jgi:hypothetical protein
MVVSMIRVKMGTHYLTLHLSATTRIPPCKENLVFELFYTCNSNVKDLYYTLNLTQE